MRKKATIVLVDNSPAVLELTEGALREAGYFVLGTSTPLEVLSVARTLKVDLVIAALGDVEDLFLEPSPPPILPILDDADDTEARGLRRPYSLDELKEAVAAVLAGSERQRA